MPRELSPARVDESVERENPNPRCNHGGGGNVAATYGLRSLTESPACSAKLVRARHCRERLLDLTDALGACVTVAYTVACLL